MNSGLRTACFLSDCFANKKDKCKLLNLAIYDNCPFYKPVMDSNGEKLSVDEYNNMADMETYFYADNRIKTITEEINELKKKLEQKKHDLSEARKRRADVKNRIQKRQQKERVDRT